VKLIEGRIEEEGKRRSCRRAKGRSLRPTISPWIKAWIDAGAPAPTEFHAKELVVPNRAACHSSETGDSPATTPKQKLIAIARDDSIELVFSDSRTVAGTLNGHHGVINALVSPAMGSSYSLAEHRCFSLRVQQ